LDKFTRDEAKTRIRELGGSISSSISVQTSFVVIGKNPGSKYSKAKKIGVKIINEKRIFKNNRVEFLILFGVIPNLIGNPGYISLR